MKRIVICLMFATMAFAKESEVKRATTQVPENQLDKLSLFGVKMGDFYDEKNNKIEHEHDSPISEVRVWCDDEKKAHHVIANFNATNMAKLNSWLRMFIDVVGRPTEFKRASKDGFIWMKFTEDNVFLTKDLNLISIYFGRDFEFASDNFVEMRWIKKVGNKIHFFEYEAESPSYGKLNWDVWDESNFPYKNNFEPMDIPKLK